MIAKRNSVERRETVTPNLHIPHGTAAILEFADTLPQHAENLRSFFDYTNSARALEICKILLDRLAPLEGDIDVTLGEE